MGLSKQNMGVGHPIARRGSAIPYASSQVAPQSRSEQLTTQDTKDTKGLQGQVPRSSFVSLVSLVVYPARRGSGTPGPLAARSQAPPEQHAPSGLNSVPPRTPRTPRACKGRFPDHPSCPGCPWWFMRPGIHAGGRPGVERRSAPTGAISNRPCLHWMPRLPQRGWPHYGRERRR